MYYVDFVVATESSVYMVTMFDASIEMYFELFIKSMGAIYMSSTTILLAINPIFRIHIKSAENINRFIITFGIEQLKSNLFNIFAEKSN